MQVCIAVQKSFIKCHRVTITLQTKWIFFFKEKTVNPTNLCSQWIRHREPLYKFRTNVEQEGNDKRWCSVVVKCTFTTNPNELDVLCPWDTSGLTPPENTWSQWYPIIATFKIWFEHCSRLCLRTSGGEERASHLHMAPDEVLYKLWIPRELKKQQQNLKQEAPMGLMLTWENEIRVPAVFRHLKSGTNSLKIFRYCP